MRIGVVALMLLAGCNALLGNDPRHFIDDAGTHVGSRGRDAAVLDAAALERELDASDDGGSEDASVDAGKADAGPPRDAGAGADAGCAAKPGAACKPGDRAQQMVACGPCNSGARVVTRTCDKTCKWSAPRADVCETDPARCEPDSVENKREACGLCGLGMTTSSRTCSTDCKWGDFVPGACTGVPDTACQPTMTKSQNVACNPNFCNKGVQAQSSTCSDQCTWGAWVDVGACAIDTNLYCQPQNLGGQPPYRCCGANQWQFCWNQGTANECTWSTDCATCPVNSQCGC
jgi:hypothetical protein